MELSIENFKLRETESVVEITTSSKMLELLQKDGYAKNVQANIPISSTIKIRQWVATIDIWEETIELVYTEEKNEFATKLDSINTQLRWLHSNKEIIVNKVCEDLLELKNSTWLEVQESPLSRELFIDNLTIDAIHSYENHDLIVGFRENYMFGGHMIQIGVKKNLILETADIAG